MQEQRTRRWQGVTLGTLFVGYAGYYICRANLSVATPMILAEYADVGFDKSAMGTVASAGVVMYALGKITNGLKADFFGGRTLFLLGMFVSALCTFLFGWLGSPGASGNSSSVFYRYGLGSISTFTLIWAANRYVQSMGWVALVKTASRWYPVSVHATILGILSMSYLFGDAFARWYLGRVIDMGVHWRTLFYVAGGTLTAIAVVSLWTLKSSPVDIGGEEPKANPDNVFGDKGDDDNAGSLAELLLPLLKNPDFWLICALNVGLTLIRETFNFWTPTYLTEVMNMDAGGAAKWSMLFPFVGAISAILAGYASDRLGGLHGRIVVPSLALLIASLVWLGTVPEEASLTLVMTLIGIVAFGLLAPYSYLSGVIALDLGGKKGSSTASGLIDSAGYCGAILSGYGVGKLAQEHGWGMAFLSLAGVAAVTAIAAVVYWWRQEFLPSRRRGTSGKLGLPRLETPSSDTSEGF